MYVYIYIYIYTYIITLCNPTGTYAHACIGRARPHKSHAHPIASTRPCGPLRTSVYSDVPLCPPALPLRTLTCLKQPDVAYSAVRPNAAPRSTCAPQDHAQLLRRQRQAVAAAAAAPAALAGSESLSLSLSISHSLFLSLSLSLSLFHSIYISLSLLYCRLSSLSLSPSPSLSLSFSLHLSFHLSPNPTPLSPEQLPAQLGECGSRLHGVVY